jgi:7-cyano-7-deazaguanine synthase
MYKSALVLFSGGQDSTTCLAYALSRYEKVETMAIDYRQRHSVELECRLKVLSEFKQQYPSWAEKLGEDHLIDFAVFGELSQTAMTREVAIAADASGLPNTFVPGRNLLFFTMAACVAYRRGLNVIVTGVCETDFSNYPDCRDATVKAQQVAIHLGMDKNIVIETPLMWLNKKETWTLAESLGGPELVAIIQEHTHTCYLGDRTRRHDWGFGCGSCPACELRARGYQQFITEK